MSFPSAMLAPSVLFDGVSQPRLASLAQAPNFIYTGSCVTALSFNFDVTQKICGYIMLSLSKLITCIDDVKNVFEIKHLQYRVVIVFNAKPRTVFRTSFSQFP